jgi:hypothetical protein
VRRRFQPQLDLDCSRLSSVLIGLDRSILVYNPNGQVTMAVSSGSMMAAALEHPNGKVFQQLDRVDIIAYDGSKKNCFV